ncbi:MAG: hypothetical protein INQ03_16980 [Candidatus Heimdallarchaeota archaeon]|nr:hypothetical protein [Candidatus Heimdallarchaeota archaeon]
MKLKTAELYIGIPVLILVGSLFHFLFIWTNYFLPTAWLFAVNESPWEHTKLVFFPMILYMLITYPLTKDEANNIFLAKIIHYAIGVIFIVGVYYAYSTILGYHIFPVDVSLFIVGTIVGLLASYKIQVMPQLPANKSKIILILFLLMVLAVIIWTYNPPDILMFQDDNTLTWGPVTEPYD